MRLSRYWLLAPVVAAALAAAPHAHAATPSGSPVGLWQVSDGEGVIGIEPCGSGLCGRIVGVAADPGNSGKPATAKDGRSLCNLIILQATHQSETGVWDGTILNPNDGSNWTCQVWVEPDGLHLRGYLLTPLLGETRIWKPFTGQIGPDCRILR